MAELIRTTELQLWWTDKEQFSHNAFFHSLTEQYYNSFRMKVKYIWLL